MDSYYSYTYVKITVDTSVHCILCTHNTSIIESHLSSPSTLGSSKLHPQEALCFILSPLL